MHRLWNVTWKFKARHRQLQIDVSQADTGVEQRHWRRTDPQCLEHLVKAKSYRTIDSLVEVTRDGCVCVMLFHWRKAKEDRRAVFPRPMQNRGAAEGNGRPCLTRAEQGRQYAKEHVVAENRVRAEAGKKFLQPLMLSRNVVDEKALQGYTQPIEPRRQSF